MLIPVDWLNEYVPNDLSLRDLATVLTDVGLEVEAIEDVAGAAVLNITVPSNRGDCLSVVGVARELAVALRAEMRSCEPAISEFGPSADGMAAVVLEDPHLCPRYSARIVRNVKIAPSPEWAQRRLGLCGLRAVNNVVDATNLVMLELGQPLHAFDYRLLQIGKDDSTPVIIVRRARSGERLVTIDGEERSLVPEVLVIADPEGAIALAGIMGGASTEIYQGTTEVLLESAHFDPRTVRRGARALRMSTEASYRFERVVDPGGTVRALDRACELIAEFSQQPVEIASGVVDAYPAPIPEAIISLRPARANALLGLGLSAADMADHLGRLGLEVEQGERLTVRVPSFRQDLKEEIDLVEEIARAHGYQNIGEALPRASAGVGCLPADVSLERRVRALLRGLGLSEAVTPSLESPEALSRLGLPAGHALSRAVAIENAKTVDRSQLRSTLLTSLLEVAAGNRRHGLTDVGLFDVGRVYWSRGGSELPEQPQHLGILGTGARWRGRWAMPRESEKWDFYSLKGIVEAVLQAVCEGPAVYSPASHPCLQQGRSAEVALDSGVVGYLGEVAGPVRQAHDLPDRVYFAELDLDMLLQHAAPAPRYRPVSRYPAVTRDVACVVRRGTPAQLAEAAIRESGGPYLESVSLFDAYEGEPLPEGERNLAFSLAFRAGDRTLTDEEVEEIMDQIRARLRDDLGAEIRE